MFTLSCRQRPGRHIRSGRRVSHSVARTRSPRARGVCPARSLGTPVRLCSGCVSAAGASLRRRVDGARCSGAQLPCGRGHGVRTRCRGGVGSAAADLTLRSPSRNRNEEIGVRRQQELNMRNVIDVACAEVVAATATLLAEKWSWIAAITISCRRSPVRCRCRR